MPAARIIWLRNDLRLADNPALAGAEGAGPCVPVYVWSPDEEGIWPPGSASRWWLARSLARLHADLQAVGSRLTVVRGPTPQALVRVARSTGARSVAWNRRPERSARMQEHAVETALAEAGIASAPHTGSWLIDPSTLLAPSTKPYQVFTAFYRAALRQGISPEAVPAPQRLTAPEIWPASESTADIIAGRMPDDCARWPGVWTPGEAAAQQALKATAAKLSGYSVERDRPASDGVSRLSPHLHFGEIGPGQVWRALAPVPGAEAFLRQIMWREFSHHLLYHFPHTECDPLRSEFQAFPWRRDPDGLAAWREGRTGYPLVDAAMRELAATGYMHNRCRMVAASFLTKHLLIHWLEGARWFWERLVDADLPNNTMGWQWTAGCGADAAPYYRIFNPVAQGMRFDPLGAYIRRWVPELADLPDEWVHRPWQARSDVLAGAGIRLGSTYPAPIVDHNMARARALEAYGMARMRNNREPIARAARKGNVHEYPG